MMTSISPDVTFRWRHLLLPVALFCLYWLWSAPTFDPASLQGKRVLITGGSAGIGEQMAYHYARLGAHVLITARTESKLKQVVENCIEYGRHTEGQYHYISADMSNITSTAVVIEKAVSQLGGLDILVLNHILPHAISEWSGSSDNLTLYDTLVDVNYRAYVHLASHALLSLKESHGSIVVVSSIAGRLPQPFLSAYSSTKFALEGFFGSLRQEFLISNTPIAITLCVIGLTDTQSTVDAMTRFNLQFILNTLPASSPSDTALAIIQGGATRQQEVFYPYMEAKVTMLRDWIPNVLAAINRYMYTQR